MKIFGILAVAIVALSCVALSRGDDDSQDSSSITKVSTNQKSKLVQIESPVKGISIYVAADSVTEEMAGDTLFRSATVIYHFDTPMAVRDDTGEAKEVHFMSRSVGYHCESKAYITISAVLYGKDVNEPLFSLPEGNVKEAAPGTPVFAEMEYVCKVNLKKKTPKSEPESFSVIKPLKSVDI